MLPVNLFRTALLFVLLFQISCLRAQTKHALIFGIGDYKYWRDISSKNDIPFVKTTLLKQNFQEKNITVLEDTAATRANMDNAFKGLIARVQQDDIVFIHISSHGEQIEDNNRDETDGLDESIVCYDAAFPIAKENFKKDQDKYFRDDQFGGYIEQLRSKLGQKGDVIVIIDACHSGSGTRGSRKIRGGAPPFVSSYYKAEPNTKENSPADVFLEGRATRGEAINLATYIVISGARATELNSETDNEGTDMGSLTFAVGKVFEKLSPGTTYRTLFSGILSVMAEIVPEQHPVIEGNGLDRVLFGGNFVDQKPYIEIEEINGELLTLRAGLLAGLDTGAKVAVFKSGTNDPSQTPALSAGVIISAAQFTSKVKLDKDPGINAAAGWVFITEPVYNTKPLVIEIAPVTRGDAAINFSETEREAIKNTFKEFPVVKTEGEPELLLVKGNGADSLKFAGNGYLFSTIKNSQELKDAIKRYTQYKFLQKIEIKDTLCSLDVQLITSVNGKPDKSSINKNMVNDINEFSAGDTIYIWAKNNGQKPVYLNILDIQPDGIINPILPNTSIRPPIYPGDLKIDPGQEILYDKYRIKLAPPFGMETFKIFVSETEINMESIAKSPGTAKRGGSFSALEKLVNKSYTVAARGGNVENTYQAEGSTYNLLFRIKPVKKQ